MNIYVIYILVGYIYGMYLLFYGSGRERDTLIELSKFGVKVISRRRLTFIRFFCVLISELLWPIDMVYDIFVFIGIIVKKNKK